MYVWEIIKRKFIPLETLGNPVIGPQRNTVQESTRDIASRKRVAKAFAQQQTQMKARALKPHDPTCKDPLMCKQISCFKRVPDKIVSDPYTVQRRMRKRRCSKKNTA